MSSKILSNLNKSNLHHAYLIEGAREEVVAEIKDFVASLGVKILANQDFSHIEVDSFKVDDARNLKSLGGERGISSDRKVFLISANSFLLEAQNTLLKIFEEPIPNTIFFLVVPDVNSLLPTFVSRFYLIKSNENLEEKEAEKFIKSSIPDRLLFIKDLLAEPDDEDEEGNEIVVLNSVKSKALRFLNALEFTLHQKTFSEGIKTESKEYFEQIFKVRKFLRMPGSSAKSLMESVALVTPKI